MKIKGMHCKSCEEILKDVLEEIKGVKVLSADNRRGEVKVKVEDESAMPLIKKAIEKEGYKLAGVV